MILFLARAVSSPVLEVSRVASLFPPFSTMYRLTKYRIVLTRVCKLVTAKCTRRKVFKGPLKVWCLPTQLKATLNVNRVVATELTVIRKCLSVRYRVTQQKFPSGLSSMPLPGTCIPLKNNLVALRLRSFTPPSPPLCLKFLTFPLITNRLTS